MKLCFSNGVHIDLELSQDVVSTDLIKIYKHLQHAPLKFTKWDNPFYFDSVSFDDLVKNLIEAGQQVGVVVDPLQCIPYNQQYLNYLHKIYEKNYNGNSQWLDYHEQIHLCEFYCAGSTLRSATIDYREQAGPLIKPFKNEYLDNLITEVEPGTVFVEWSELGKTPYDYWADQEPDDITRICELAKPWQTFKPKLRIAMHRFNTMRNVDPNFSSWWDKYKVEWCKHWNLNNWSVEDMHGVIKVGNVKDVDAIAELFKQRYSILAVRLL